MAQTTSLALGTTAATSADIVVPANVTAIIGIFAAAGVPLPGKGTTGACRLMQVTPGAPNLVTLLDDTQPSVAIQGPGTFRVMRSAVASAVGVWTEQ